MTTYIHKLSSRSLASILTALFSVAFGGLCWFLVFTSSIGFFGVVLAVYGTFGLLYCIYFWLRPVTWSVELTSERLRWQSPHWPRQTREIPVSDIVAASATDTVELRLSSGETVRLPPTCVGRHPGSLVRALTQMSPGISSTDANVA
ncbi:MAG TPA: hypothetical protein VIT91_16395 [Chthoniobacterales bacterium]